MKILILYKDIDSGAKVATEALIERFAKQTELELIVYKQPSNKYRGSFSFLLNLIWSILDFRHTLNESKDLELVYTPEYRAIIAFWLSRYRKKIPVVWHLHGDQAFASKLGKTFEFKEFYRWLVGTIVLSLQTQAFKIADFIIFVSGRARREYLKKYNLSNHFNKTTVVHNGVNLEYFKPVQDQMKVKLKRQMHISQKQVVLYVGRIDPKKGLDLLLKAVDTKKLVEKDVLLLVAHPQFMDEYSQIYLKYLYTLVGHTPVRFISPHGFLGTLYQVADCVILPSHQEMMPLVMLEALACGVPFIGSKEGEMKNVLSPFQIKNFPALLNKPTINEIRNSLDRFLDLDTNDLLRWKKACLSTAKQYSWERSAKQIYQEVLTQPLQYFH